MKPESDWERRATDASLSGAEIAAMMAPVAERVDAVRYLRGGLVNTNVRVDTPAGQFVLRVYRRDPAACAKEAALLRRLGDLAPVPRLRHARPDGLAPFLVMDWVDGERLVDVLAVEPHPRSLMTEVGAVLRAIHTISFPTSGFFDRDLEVTTPFGSMDEAWREYLEGHVSGAAGEPLGPARCRAIERLLAVERIGATPPVLLHADYKPTNILVRRDPWHVAAVLDWEFAWAGPACFDLGQLLRWAHAYPPEYEAGVVDGYADGYSLPTEWRRQSRLLDLMNLVGFLADAGDRRRMAADVLALVDRSLVELGVAPPTT